MARYIDVDEAIINFGFEYEDIPPTREEFVGFLKRQKTVDAVPVVHGHWINTPPYTSIGGEYKKAQRCSVCNALYISAGNTQYSNHRYCAECGAKMDGGERMTERERLITLLMKSRIYLTRGEAEAIADDICSGGVKLPVRCGECEHYRAERKDDKYGVCRYWQYYMDAPEVCADDFCCHGERREDNG